MDKFNIAGGWLPSLTSIVGGFTHMAHFIYTARSKSGDKVTGDVDADDKAAAQKKIEGWGLVPVSITLDETGVAEIGSAPTETVRFTRSEKAAGGFGQFLGLTTGVILWQSMGGTKGFIVGTVVSFIVGPLLGAIFIGIVGIFTRRSKTAAQPVAKKETNQ